jgi:hypothetical protein
MVAQSFGARIMPSLLVAMMRLCSGLLRLLCSMLAESLVLESCQVNSRHDKTLFFFSS